MTVHVVMRAQKNKTPNQRELMGAKSIIIIGGGMPAAVMSGNHTIRFNGRKDNRPFGTA
ncbi:MAG: hypothetical protein WBQ62_08475 [Dehalococcoidales bacterium]